MLQEVVQPLHFFFLMIRRPLRSTLFPYTTLFRSTLTRLPNLAPGFIIDRDSIALTLYAFSTLRLTGNKNLVKAFRQLTTHNVVHQMVNIQIEWLLPSKHGRVKQRRRKAVPHSLPGGPAATRAGNCPRQDVSRQTQGKPLVSTKRKQRAFRRTHEISRIGAGATLRVHNATRGNRLAAVVSDGDLASSDGAGGKVNQDGRSRRTRDRDGNGIRREPPLPTAPGRHQFPRPVSVHEHDSGQAGARGHEGVIPYPANVAALAHGNGHGAGAQGLLDTEFHGFLRHDLSPTPIASQDGKCLSLLDDLHVRPNVDELFFHPAHILGNANHSV